MREVFVLTMRLPSCSTCIFSVIDSALYGFPVTASPTTRPSPETTRTNVLVAGTAPGATTSILSGSEAPPGSPVPCAAAPCGARSARPASGMMGRNCSFMSLLLKVDRCGHEDLVGVNESNRSRDAVRAEEDVRLDAGIGLGGVHDGKGRNRDVHPNDAVRGAGRHAGRERERVKDGGASGPVFRIPGRERPRGRGGRRSGRFACVERA